MLIVREKNISELNLKNTFVRNLKVSHEMQRAVKQCIIHQLNEVPKIWMYLVNTASQGLPLSKAAL